MPGSSGTKSQWPESHGFSIAGNGPCYVIAVSKARDAYKAGISPGDQLLEVANHNVTDMSAGAIKILARHSQAQPPNISVVSKMQYIDLMADRKWGYGFIPKGVRPTVIGSVDPPGPAYHAGIRQGDIILEVNGKELKHPKYLEPILQTKYGRITLGIVPMDGKFASLIRKDRQKKEPEKHVLVEKHVGRVKKARELFSKMNVYLGQDFQKKLAVVELLKRYSEDRQIDKFAKGLKRILVTQKEKRLLEEIRPFVPMKQVSRFDEMLNFTPQRILSSSSQLNMLTISTGSQNSKPATRHNESIGGTGLLAIAKTMTKPRTLIVERASSGSFGFILRGHNPVCVESTILRGPADKAGLKAGDQIVKVNGIDVSKCSHDHLVSILQSSGDVSTVEVVCSQAETKQEKQDNIRSFSSPDSHRTTSSWLSDSGITLDGHSFRDKVEMLLTSKEKMSIRLALIEYNMNRNIAQLVDDGNSILDTPSKRALWVFILHRLTKDHQNYVFKYVNIPKRYMQDIMNKVSKVSHDNTAEFLKSPTNTSEMLTSTDHTETTDDTIHSANYHLASYKKQLDYLLTSRERSQLRKALQIYIERKNVHHLLGDLSDILDTASKKTLWFYIIPQLQIQHQSYVQRVLGLPQRLLKNEHTKKETGHSHSKGVLPKYGDILYLQNEFVGSFLKSQRATNAYSSDDDLDDLVPAHGDSLTSEIDHHTPSTLSSENLFVAGLKGRHKRPTLPGNGKFGRNGLQPLYSSDVEHSTMVLNPIYAEIDHSAKSSPVMNTDTRPKTKLVRESAAQTTPQFSPVHYNQQMIPGKSSMGASEEVNNHADFKTIVKVYGQPQRNPDIVSVCDTRGRDLNPHRYSPKVSLSSSNHDNMQYYEEPVSMENQYTNLDDVNLNGLMQREPFYHTLESHPNAINHNSAPFKELSKRSSDSNNDTQVKSKQISEEQFRNNNNRKVFPSNLIPFDNLRSVTHSTSNITKSSEPGNMNHPPSARRENGSVGAESGDSLRQGDSYHTKAMNAIMELDAVVDKEHYGSSDPDDSEVAREMMIHSKHPNYMKTPVPPPPPPPLPGTSKVGDTVSKESVRLNVKKINWEKIDQPPDNTIWAKLDKDSEDLQDVVKYLELEQQFSTKPSKLSQSLLERKTENYILSPKKAYNISILVGHLKMPETSVTQALLTMNETILTPDLLRQIITYMPDKKEQGQYTIYNGSLEDLSKPDQFMYRLSRLPGYEQRLQAMLFKVDFAEKAEELRKNLSCLKKAAQELKDSFNLSRVLELVLAMGNYMNKGSVRVGKATAFRVQFLQHLDLTKTSNGKGSFLSVLANAVNARYPTMTPLSDELPHIHQAAKVAGEPLQGELSELRRSLKDISITVTELSGHVVDSTDRFHQVMEHFISQASDDIQEIFSLYQSTNSEITSMVTYFGEDPKQIEASQIFQIFSEFMYKFEKAKQQVLLAAAHNSKNK